MRVFLDANILFSASKSAGAIHQLLSLLLKQKHILCADEYVVAEATRNLQAKAEPEATIRLDGWLANIEVSPTRVHTIAGAAYAWLPEKDQPVLAAAIRLRCHVLVTGDVTHFGKGFGKTFGSVTIYSPRMLYDEVFPPP